MKWWEVVPRAARLCFAALLTALVVAPFITASSIGVGVVLTVWGAGFVIMSVALSGSDDYMRLVAERRYRFARFFHPSWDDRDPTEWVRRDSRHQRWMMRYLLVPGGILFTAAGVFTLIVGLTRF